MWFDDLYIGDTVSPWIRLLCHLGAAFFLVVYITYLSRRGNPGRAARGNVAIAWLALFVPICLANVPDFINDSNAIDELKQVTNVVR
ncbi:MAG: hypothetical protein ABSC06_10650 [Rhodopila sp.]|jgi:hypothetical protein